MNNKIQTQIKKSLILTFFDSIKKLKSLAILPNNSIKSTKKKLLVFTHTTQLHFTFAFMNYITLSTSINYLHVILHSSICAKSRTNRLYTNIWIIFEIRTWRYSGITNKISLKGVNLNLKIIDSFKIFSLCFFKRSNSIVSQEIYS